MPEREKGEALDAFIGRFMKSKREKKKFPKVKQRLAVGFSEAHEEHKRGRKEAY